MSYLVRLIDYGIVDFFVQQVEDFRYCRNQFLKYAPYLLFDGKLYRFFGYFAEKASYGFVVAETPGYRESVVIGDSTMWQQLSGKRIWCSDICQSQD